MFVIEDLINISVSSLLNSLFLNHKHGDIEWFLPVFLHFSFLCSLNFPSSLFTFYGETAKWWWDDNVQHFKQRCKVKHSKPRRLTEDEIKMYSKCVCVCLSPWMILVPFYFPRIETGKITSQKGAHTHTHCLTLSFPPSLFFFN